MANKHIKNIIKIAGEILKGKERVITNGYEVIIRMVGMKGVRTIQIYKHKSKIEMVGLDRTYYRIGRVVFSIDDMNWNKVRKFIQKCLGE